MSTTATFIEATQALGTTGQWAATGGGSAPFVDTATKVHGYGSTGLTGGLGIAPFCTTVTGTVADAGARLSVWVSVSALTIAGAIGITIRDASANLIFRLQTTTTGTLNLSGGTGTLNKTGSTRLATATFYRVSLGYMITSTSVFAIRVYINGLLELLASGSDGTLQGSGSSCVRMQNIAGAGITSHFQDLYVDNGTDLGDPGGGTPLYVTAKRPTGTGTHNQYTYVGTGTPSHWSVVASRPWTSAPGNLQNQSNASQDEDFAIEAAASGDDNLTGATLVAYGAWQMGALLNTGTTPTVSNFENGTVLAWSPGASATFQINYATSSTFPATAPICGQRGSNGLAGGALTPTLYACGIVVAYLVPPPVPADGVYLQLMLTPAAWTDVSSDWFGHSGASIKYGMADGQPTTRVAQTGEFKFWLNNSPRNSQLLQGLYSPANANVRTGFGQYIPCRVVFVSAGVSYYKFTGRVKEIAPTPGKYLSQDTPCTAVDYMDDLARANLTGIPAQVSLSEAQQLLILMGAMAQPPFQMLFDAGVSIFPYGMVGGSGGVINGLQEVQRLTASEQGYVYVKGDQTNGGVLRFENRHARILNTTSLASLADTMQPPMTAVASIDDVINEVQATVHPRKVDASPVVLYSSITATSTSPTLIAPGATVTINGPYRDPSQTVSVSTASVAGTAMITPVATTDYTANSAANGSGTDLTSAISIVTTFGSTGATFAITNTGTQAAYLTKLQCRGTGLYDYGPTVAISKDVTSQAAYGKNVLALDMPYEADPLNGQGAADTIRIAWAYPFGFAQQVSFLASPSRPTLMTAALAREIGDRVTIQETVTGINSDFFINGIELKVQRGNLITCTWTLAPAGVAQQLWVLGVAGGSGLGLTTMIGSF